MSPKRAKALKDLVIHLNTNHAGHMVTMKSGKIGKLTRAVLIGDAVVLKFEHDNFAIEYVDEVKSCECGK